MQSAFLIGEWDDATRTWLDVTHLVASDPKAARDQFGADFEGMPGRWGVTFDDDTHTVEWLPFVILVDGPIRWDDLR